MSEEEIEEYICLHADEPLRTLQAGIKENFGVSKSLKWISKAKKDYQEELSIDQPTEDETPADRDPEILSLETAIKKEQLRKKLEMEKAAVKSIRELAERNLILESDNSLLKRKLETAIRTYKNWLNATCPDCDGKFLLSYSETNPKYARCFLCGNTWRLS